uniref:Ig-like domain-containing protein n=1 Tax=Timema cristinae TaxID=61476 RepID=A0A7R9CCR5_TIMCR|nr:unnamed protein product [Timema cristinae]
MCHPPTGHLGPGQFIGLYLKSSNPPTQKGEMIRIPREARINSSSPSNHSLVGPTQGDHLSPTYPRVQPISGSPPQTPGQRARKQAREAAVHDLGLGAQPCVHNKSSLTKSGTPRVPVSNRCKQAPVSLARGPSGDCGIHLNGVLTSEINSSTLPRKSRVSQFEKEYNSANDVVFDCCVHAHIGGGWGGRWDCQVERALLLSQCRLWRDGGMVNQHYEPEVQSPGGFLGNNVIIRCSVPSFVKERVSITSWLQEPSFNIYPSTVSEPALRDQQFSLYLAVPPSSQPASYVCMRTTVKHHVAGTWKQGVLQFRSAYTRAVTAYKCKYDASPNSHFERREKPKVRLVRSLVRGRRLCVEHPRTTLVEERNVENAIMDQRPRCLSASHAISVTTAHLERLTAGSKL